jgi:hypothetical protein
MQHLILLDMGPYKPPRSPNCLSRILHNACRVYGTWWGSACNELIALYGSHKEHQQPSEVTVLEPKLAEEPLVGSSLELLLHQLLSFLRQVIVVKL